MRILRPNGRRRLDEQVLEAALDDNFSPRLVLLLCQGDVHPETLEPFALLDAVVGDAFDRDLRLAVTDGWPDRFWEVECGQALDASDPDRDLDLAFTADQRRRALTQQVSDGQVEVLFVERGRVVGSALTVVARRADDARPLPLNAKVKVMDLLVAARDAFSANPRPIARLVQDAREALGIPAGAVTSVAAVRRARGEDAPAERAISIDRMSSMLAELAAGGPPATAPSPGVSVQGAGRTATPVRNAPPPPPAPPRPLAPPKPEERHALVDGRCTHCGRSGRELEKACGRPDLGRIGLLELD